MGWELAYVACGVAFRLVWDIYMKALLRIFQRSQSDMSGEDCLSGEGGHSGCMNISEVGRLFYMERFC